MGDIYDEFRPVTDRDKDDVGRTVTRTSTYDTTNEMIRQDGRKTSIHT